jgi:hypothetical protein
MKEHTMPDSTDWIVLEDVTIQLDRRHLGILDQLALSNDTTRSDVIADLLEHPPRGN